MGLRGPLPTPKHLQAVRGGRVRRQQAGLAPAVEQALLDRAEELQAAGLRLLKRAEKAPTVKTPSNGEQASPLFSAAHKCFDAADRIYMRLGRLKGEPDDKEGSTTADPDPLEAFRREKH